MRYQVITEECFQDGAAIRCYGIACEGGCVHAISRDRGFVERLADRLEQSDLSPLHFKDYVEDALLRRCLP